MAAAAGTPSDFELRAIDALRGVIDPELGLDVVALGLVYGVDVEAGEADTVDLAVHLTMTTPACPLGEQIVADAETALRALDGVGRIRVELVWDPPWSPERMSPSARQQLGWDV